MAAPDPNATVADVVGETIAGQGVREAFGVIGSGNLVVTNALARTGTRFHAARHEGGAISMADGYARVSGQLGVCSVHQGPGVTNAMTGLTEAAKSRTPLLMLAGEPPAADRHSNFRIDQDGLVESVGAIAERVHAPDSAIADALRAYDCAVIARRPVVLMLPVDIQAMAAADPGRTSPRALPAPAARAPAAESIAAVADLLQSARRPVIIAGRGAVLANAGAELEGLAALIGAGLATSAPAHGLFTSSPYSLGISGGFASPTQAALIEQADLILAVGASLNHWTTRHGDLIAETATIAQIDVEPDAIARHQPADIGLVSDALTATRLLIAELNRRGHQNIGLRTPAVANRLASRRWNEEPFEDASTDGNIDPRTFSIELERRLGPDKTVAVDSGAFMGYPSMYLSVPDARSWVFANGFQAVGLGLGTAIGAAVARPDRPTVAALGDGGAFMALAELDTAVRLELKLLVAIYDDRAYGAEVHHFAPSGHDVSRVQFPDADLAAIARAAGAAAITVRSVLDLHAVTDWLAEASPRPLVIDAKVNPAICAEWLGEAFRAG